MEEQIEDKRKVGRPKGSTKAGNKINIPVRIKPGLADWLRNQPAGISPTIERLIEKAIE